MKKFVNVNDNINNESQIRNLTIIPSKELNNVMEIYHKITGHKNYNILHEKILLEGYYWNYITDSYKEFKKTSSICIVRNKNNSLSPPINQILPSKFKK